MTTTPDVESAPPAELGRRARRDQKTAKRPKPVTEKAAGVPLTERVAGVASGIGTRWREWVSLFEPVLEPVRRVLVCVSTLGWLTLAAALGCWLLAAAFGWREFAYAAAVLLCVFLLSCLLTIGRMSLDVTTRVEPQRVVAGDASAI